MFRPGDAMEAFEQDLDTLAKGIYSRRLPWHAQKSPDGVAPAVDIGVASSLEVIEPLSSAVNIGSKTPTSGDFLGSMRGAAWISTDS
jgi:hypothetical protein